MGFNQRQFKAGLKKYRVGLIVGALTGAVAAYYSLYVGFDLNVIVNSGTGLIDNLLGRSAPLQVAEYKLYGAFIFIGAIFGFFADMAINKISGNKR